MTDKPVIYKPGVETPEDTAKILEDLGRPFTKTELKERKAAIRSGELVTPARDELPGAAPAVPVEGEPADEGDAPEGEQGDRAPTPDGQGDLFE